MKIRTVQGVYFSATGTTERVVTCVAKAAAMVAGAEYKSFSFSLPLAREQLLEFTNEDLVVIGIPTYAGRVPNLLLPFIREKILGNGALATPVTLFGNRNFDDALIELRDILQGNGFYTISAGAFVGEHSFSTILGADRPDDEDMALAAKLGEETAKKIQHMYSPPAEAIPVKGEVPLRPYYTPRDRHGNPINILKVKPKTNISKCVKCGLCAAVCTMGSIDPDDVSSVTGICVKCNACTKKCPAQAKYFDDEGYNYHRSELEEIYGDRACVELFY